MSTLKRWFQGGASVALLALAAGCSNPEIVDAPPPAEVAPPPPPSQAYVAPAPVGRVETTELLGGPSPSDAQPRPAPARTQTQGQPQVVSMAPIPNPGEGRRRPRVYRDPAIERPYREPTYQRPPVATTARPPRVVQSRPVANPPSASAPGPVTHSAAPVRPAPTRPAPVKPAPTVKPAPAPVSKPAAPPVVAAKPVAPVTKAKPVPALPVKPNAPAVVKPATPPALAAAKPAAPAKPAKPEKPKTKAELVGMAVANEVTSGGKLVLPPELGEGKQGVVSLTLPATLADRIAAEAVKQGLKREARTIDARAILSGDGYTVIPSASQSARLKAGEATTFNWQVTPTGAEHGALKADVSGDLKGGVKPQGFAITSLEQAPAAVVEEKKSGFDFSKLFGKLKKPAPAETAQEPDTSPAVQAPAAEEGQVTRSGVVDKLSLPGMSKIDIPGAGAIKSGFAVIGALGVLALVLIMAVVSRVASRRRAAERRRKFRTMTEFHSDPEPVHETHHTPVHQEPETVHYEPVSETHHTVVERKEDEHA